MTNKVINISFKPPSFQFNGDKLNDTTYSLEEFRKGSFETANSYLYDIMFFNIQSSEMSNYLQLTVKLRLKKTSTLFYHLIRPIY